MSSFLVQTPEGPRICELFQAGNTTLADGQSAWVFNDKDGNQVMTRIGVGVELMQCVNMAPEGMILEFGVAGGNSIRRIAESGKQIYGFDWWGGIPHAWSEADPRGTCKADKPEGLPSNVTLIDGLFSDTLEGFLDAHDGPVGFVHIDCDLYCPTVFILHCLVDRFVSGSIIAFDEIDQNMYGELQAWCRYLNETKQGWEFLGKQHAFGEVYRLA